MGKLAFYFITLLLCKIHILVKYDVCRYPFTDLFFPNRQCDAHIVSQCVIQELIREKMFHKEVLYFICPVYGSTNMHNYNIITPKCMREFSRKRCGKYGTCKINRYYLHTVYISPC